jgi:hypothetical protein
MASHTAFTGGYPTRGGWPLVGFFHWLSQLILIWPALIVYNELLVAEMDAAHLFEGSGREAVPRPPEILTFDWLLGMAPVLAKAATMLLPGTLLVLAIMIFAERDGKRGLPVWLLAGGLAALPLVGFSVLVVNRESPPGEATLDNLLALLPIATSMIGILVARRVRHRGVAP